MGSAMEMRLALPVLSTAENVRLSAAMGSVVETRLHAIALRIAATLVRTRNAVRMGAAGVVGVAHRDMHA